MGDSKASLAELYGDILQPHLHLLDAAGPTPEKSAELFANYCQEVNARMMYQPGVDYTALQKSITKVDVSLVFPADLQEIKQANNPLQ